MLKNPFIQSEAETGSILPDFCSGRTVFLLVLVTELFVLTMVLGASGIRAFSWDYLALASLLVQWVVLLSAAIFCRLRKAAQHWTLLQTLCFVYLTVLTVTALATWAGEWVLAGADWNASAIFGWPTTLARNLLVSAIMTGLVLRHFYVQARLRRQEQAELQSRIQALQARIRPHFLFNSMNSIASLIASDPAAAERAVEDLSDLFRASLSSDQQTVPLLQEIDLCQQYLAIERLRLGERLQVKWRVEDYPSDARIPLLTLQPLLENAIYHGIQPLAQGGLVSILIQYRGDLLEMTVSNPCSEEAVTPTKTNHHIALNNIEHRLRAIFGKQARLTTHRNAELFVVQISYPLHGDRAYA